jgi:hypothetical protein
MRKIQFLFFLLLFSCLEKEPEMEEKLPEINLSTAYASSNSEVEVAGSLLASDLNDEVEYGIVWSETPNPTTENQKNTISKIDRGTRFNAKITALKSGSKIFVRAFVKNIKSEIKYSNEIEVLVEVSKIWQKLGDLEFEEGQFSGVATKLDDQNLTFLRLNQYNEWEQFKHYYNGSFNRNNTWYQEKFSFPQFSARQEPFFFTLNFSKDFTRPSAFLGGGFSSQTNAKIYLKDMYWVYDNQNFLDPMPLGDGPIAYFSLNRNAYLLEENNTDKFWSYFSLEQFIKRQPFPKIGSNFDYLGAATKTKGYILAQNLNEKEAQLFEYDDVTDKWTQKKYFPGNGRLEGVFFSLKNKIYYGLGRNSNPVRGLSDIWEFDPKANEWRFIANYPGAGNIKVMASEMAEYALIYCGYQVRASEANAEKYYNANDTWMFRPNN